MINQPEIPLIPRPSFPKEARDLLNRGRECLKSGAREEALALFRAAVALDASVLCLPWGLLPHLKREGRGSIRRRFEQRMRAWYREASPAHALAAQLSDKARMQHYIRGLGLPLPQQFQTALSLADLDWAGLPDRLVIKPTDRSVSRGAILAAEGRDLVANAPITPDLPSYAQTLYDQTFDSPPKGVIAEEFLRDVDADRDPSLLIPRDVKVFAVAGHVGYVRVHDRNTPEGRGKRSLAAFDRKGRRLPSTLTIWPEAEEGQGVPSGYDRLIAMAEHLSQQLPWLMRLDFYLTPEGPVFGEFTSFSNAGRNQSPFARRTLLQMWEIWPD